MRTIKTAVAVVLSYLIFLPLALLFPVQYGVGQSGAFCACIAAVICMQSSVGQSMRQGVARLLGTAIGGLLGLLLLTIDRLLSQPLFLALMLGAGTIACIWLCNLLERPGACAISVVVLCVILLNHAGPERYMYALGRMVETAVGVVLAVVVNRVLPDHRKSQPNDKNTPVTK